MIWHKPVWDTLLARLRHGNISHATLVTGSDGCGNENFVWQMVALLLCEARDDQNKEAQHNQQGQYKQNEQHNQDGQYEQHEQHEQHEQYKQHDRQINQNACGCCQSCRLIQTASHPDCYLLQGDSIKIDALRDCQDKLIRSGQIGPRKVLIIQPAEAMTRGTAHALLKILEEPPPHTYFILQTSRAKQLLPTIISRCSQLRLPNPTRAQALDWLQMETGKPVSEELSSLLDVFENAPIAAKNSMGWSFYGDLKTDLLSLIHHTNTPTQLAEKYEKIDLETVFIGLFYWIKKFTFEGKTELTKTALPLFWDYCLQKRQNCLKVATINKRLLLESLFIYWQGLKQDNV